MISITTLGNNGRIYLLYINIFTYELHYTVRMMLLNDVCFVLHHRSKIRYLSKKYANFNEFSEIKKIRKNSHRLRKSRLWADHLALLATIQQQQLKNLIRFTVLC